MKPAIALLIALVFLVVISREVAATFGRDGFLAGAVHFGCVLVVLEICIRARKNG